jgi:hypothetical protein
VAAKNADFTPALPCIPCGGSCPYADSRTKVYHFARRFFSAPNHEAELRL